MTDLRHIDGMLVGKNFKAGILYTYRVAVPQTDAASFALLIEHDGLNDAHVNALLRLAEERRAPYCVCVGVGSGRLPMPGGGRRNMRMNSYDLFDREFSDFLVYELIPHLTEAHDLPIDSSPDMHMISGSSSGGISAFVSAWFHSEYFRRVYMGSPSFLAMGRGNEIPYLIRKYETKPIRIYEEYSENEPNDYFGASRPVDEEMRMALTFAGYDFACTYFPNEGHSSRYHDEDEAYRRNAWLWRGWQSGKICAPANSPRVDKIIPRTSRWEAVGQFPETAPQRHPMLSALYRHAVRSGDGQAWYAANEDEAIVYLYPDFSDIGSVNRLLHAVLHTIPRHEPKGVLGMVVDKKDRLYVLTEIGIQCVRSFGLIDVILDLPDTSAPLDIAVTDALYVRTELGCYRRALCEACITADESGRGFVGYYD